MPVGDAVVASAAPICTCPWSWTVDYQARAPCRCSI